MTTLPPVPPGTPDPPTPRAEVEAVRKALEPDYEVQEELGRGGMAVVYRARDKALDREVAIKVLPTAMSVDADFVERFQREARTAGQLEHPNIVPIYRVGRAGESPAVIFFVMKMLRGQSLSAVLRGRGKLGVDEVRRVMKETASALGFATKKGVIHRDIKPDNILLDDEGRCVVTDFGIAKTSSGPHTAAGTSMGTPRYMSPEHAQGTPVDGRSDIYSLGVVAYQCLVGRTPFDADNPFAILYKHINETLPRPELNTPEEWELYAVIQKMLAKPPAERYQTADDLLFALGADTTANTLTAALPTRLSAMVKTEVITRALPWFKQQEWYRKTEEYGERFGVKAWHLGAAVVGVFVIGGAMAALGGPNEPVADSVSMKADTQAVMTAVTKAVMTAGATTGATTGAVGQVTPLSATGNIVAPPLAGTTTGAKVETKADTKTGGAVAAAARRPVREAFSRCPATGSSALTKMASSPVLLLDSIAPHKPGDTLRVNYDVCGLRSGSAFTTEVTLHKIRQARLRRALGAAQEPVIRTYPDAATGPRTRRRRTFPLAGVSPGTYSAEVVITDAQGRRLQVRREFQLLDK